jgi:hypothetical protein
VSQKYDLPRIVTNDLYLAAYLLCQGCSLDQLVRNDRRRISFVFVGEKVRQLREAYRTGSVRLNVRSFRDSLVTVRRRMDARLRSEATAGEPEQRSVPHATSPCMQSHATV